MEISTTAARARRLLLSKFTTQQRQPLAAPAGELPARLADIGSLASLVSRMTRFIIAVSFERTTSTNPTSSKS